MSTSLLYHTLGTINYRYVKTEYKNGRLLFHIIKKKNKRKCPVCKSREVTCQGGRSYEIQTLPFGFKQVWLCVHLKVLKCKSCGAQRQGDREIALPRKTYTKKLARMVVDLAKYMTLKDIADFLQLKWHLVRDMVRENLQKQEARRSWRDVRFLAIDEIAIRKGHRYMTVVVDLESGLVLDVVNGRDAMCLQPVFTRLKRARARLQAVAVDMSPAYRKAIETYAPGVTIVHDRFHVVQAANAALDQVRREEQRVEQHKGRSVIKGHRFLLLKGREKVENHVDSASKLQQLFELNENLYRAYLLKEDLREFWNQPGKKQAELFLQTWLKEASSLNSAPMNKLARMIARHKDSILSWYDFPISTGPLEGLNNKIKVLKRRAYGFRNHEFFRLLVLFLHQKKFKLNGT